MLRKKLPYVATVLKNIGSWFDSFSWNHATTGTQAVPYFPYKRECVERDPGSGMEKNPDPQSGMDKNPDTEYEIRN